MVQKQVQAVRTKRVFSEEFKVDEPPTFKTSSIALPPSLHLTPR